AARIRNGLQLVREAGQYLTLGPRPSLAGLGDPRAILERIQIEGASCSAAEILCVVEVARAASAWRTLFVDTGLASLDALAQSLPDLREVSAALGGKILPDGRVDSSASPALAAIRRAIERLERELHSSLEKLLHRLGQDQILQEELITLRNGRFVMPVRAEKRKSVLGIVHGASSSGASVYVEPLETVPMNNELVELEEREAAEIRRILAEFTGILRSRRQDLMDATATLSELDLAFAKAEFARRWNACLPELCESWELELQNARHPLLELTLRAAGCEPVPLTLDLAPPHRIMVISGPNTGGKTVALKTAGMAALMAQAGLPVLATVARLPVFTRVLADIGDQQSISQSLSTFSAHIRNIQSMLNATESRDLVLLDEIGGSTDPQEGSALAIAILERFRAQGCMVIVSTHHSRLKSYAAETPEALNAAMDFDEVTLAPTYHILAGLPGKSSGIDIAQRLGLDGGIIHKARELMDPADAQASALIASLHSRQAELDARLGEVRRQAQEIEEMKAGLAWQAAAERQAKLRELDERLERTLREYDQQFKQAIEEIRRQLAQEGKPARSLAKGGRKAESLRRDAREEWNAQVLETAGPPAVPGEAGNQMAAAVGDHVQIQNFSTPGIVTAIRDGDQIEVEVGRLRLCVAKNEVRVLGRGQTASSGWFESSSTLTAEPPTELNVIGRTAEEAREQVDKLLDEAFLAGRFKLRIVHGHGKGVLKHSLRKMFASHPHVETFYAAPPREGGEGATIVELKK
ncbi:MAG TPA: Smr/MutS family protein, partial [Terriglobia bacterium]|nr:Smr/MutS family protein [Terriglobia bacterium]